MITEYEPIRLSADYLTKKIYRLIDMGMMYVEVDVINLTGELYLFKTSFCAN